MTPAAPATLEAALLRLAAERPELGIDTTGAAPSLRSLAEVAGGPVLDDWLAGTASLADDMDPRTAAAYLVSILVWKLGEILGSAYLLGAPLPPLTADDVAASLEVRGEGKARDIAFHFRFSPTGLSRSAYDREALANATVAIHEPLVAALHQRTGLSRRALWRLVMDGISGGMLAHAKAADCIDLARQEADAAFSDANSPLHNRQWRYVEITSEGVQSQWFRLRGGCCRLYRTAGNDYCTTCVLRSPESQIERLTSRLR